MNKEQLKELQDELEKKQAFEYAVGAFSSLVQTYDVAQYVKDLPINRLTSLIAKVEEAIVQAVKEFAQAEETL